MSNDTDYQLSISLKSKIKNGVTIRDLFEKHGVDLLDEMSGEKAKCLCPFHMERTPSCYVDYTKGLFYCFGCKANGDIFDFVKLKYGFRSWYEIINYFCLEYNIVLDEYDNDDKYHVLKYINEYDDESDNEINNFNNNVLIISSLLKKYCDKYNFSNECMDKIIPIYVQIDKIIESSQDKNLIEKNNVILLNLMSHLLRKANS